MNVSSPHICIFLISIYTEHLCFPALGKTPATTDINASGLILFKLNFFSLHLLLETLVNITWGQRKHFWFIIRCRHWLYTRRQLWLRLTMTQHAPMILVILILRSVLEASKIMWKERRLVSLFVPGWSGKYLTVVSVSGQNQSGPGLHLVRREKEETHCSLGLCHVTFCSSVNVVDYFLRDQNWLPGIIPPSISAESGTRAGAHPAWAHGMRTTWSRCLNRWWSSGVTQLVTQYKPQLWLFFFFFLVVSQKNKVLGDRERIQKQPNPFWYSCLAPVIGRKPISAVLWNAYTAWRITLVQRHLWPDNYCIHHPQTNNDSANCAAKATRLHQFCIYYMNIFV